MELKKFTFLLFILPLAACRPISESFEPVENAVTYTASPLKNHPLPTSDIKLLCWNIRFGIARFDWFGDACGTNTLFSKKEVEPNLLAIANKVNQENPDIWLMQECDINSKRSAYIHEINFFLNHTEFNYAYYGPTWQSQFIPSHGLGRMNMGIVIFSKWPLDHVERLSLPLRGDQDKLEKYFYLRYCMLKAELNITGFKPVHIFNVHSVAFTTDETKKQHYDKIKEEFDKVNNAGGYFVAGGDFNTLPPGASQTDYCMEDICSGESFHNAGNNHKEGSNYAGEDVWVNPIFTTYNPSLPLAKYLANESAYFTHTTRHPNQAPDRRLDYFFTNYQWVPGSDTTFHDVQKLSDHMPIRVQLKLPL